MISRGSGRSWAGGVLGAAMAMAVAPPAEADEIQLSINDGRVTLVATDARLADVLAVWAQVGRTRFVDAEALGDESVTAHMVDVDEAEALRVLLRPAAGYIAAQRRAASRSISRYDRVKVLATRPSPPAEPRAATAAAGVPIPASAEEAEVQLDHLQALLDRSAGAATNATADRANREPPAGDPAGPALLTPVPGIAGAPARPPRWQRRPRRPSDSDPFGGASDPPVR